MVAIIALQGPVYFPSKDRIIKAMILLFGASASGKTEIAKALERNYGIKKAITTTTRTARAGEKDGISYFFIDEDTFLKRLRNGLFVEHTIYNGHYYGTGKDQIAKEKCIVVDPKGVESFQKLFDPSIVSFYLEAKEGTRRERMESRGDKKEEIEKRLDNDRVAFAIDALPKTDFSLSTDERSIEDLTKEIHSLYLGSLKQRGLID